MKIVSVESVKCYGYDRFSGLYCSPLYTSFFLESTHDYGKMLENGTAGSVGEDQNSKMKF